MPSVNATATALRTAPNPIQTALSPPANRLSSAQLRNSPTARHIQLTPEGAPAGGSPASRDSKLPIPCPVYSSILGAKDIPDSWKKNSIYDQVSLEKSWSKVVVQLQDGHVSEKDVYQTLKSGFLQTPTGKVLAPLFIESIMRSIRPLGDLKQEQLREFVEVICLFPPARWADSFGENVNFPRGKYGEGVHGIIQDQLTATRAERDQKIADGELLDDDTWQALRDFTQQTRQYIPASSDAELNAILTQLEDLIHIRPSPKEAMLLMDDFVEAMHEPRPDEFQRWPENFSAIVQKFSERLKTIEIIDNRPDRTWLEEIVAIGALSPVSLKDVGGAASSAVRMAYDFVFGGKTEPAPPEKMQGPSPSKLLLSMQEIERTSSFYNEVVMTGPGVPNGLAAKMLYAVNAMHTVGLMDVLPNLPLTSPAISPTALAILPKTATVHTPPTLKEQAEGLATEVDDFIASIKSATGTGSEENVSHDPGAADAPASSTVLPMLDQLAQSIREVLSRVDDALTFPAASALPTENIPLAAMETGEYFDPLNADPIYADTVEPSPSWREAIAPAINQVVSRLAAVLNTFGGYTVGAAASGFQLARNNPGTAAVVGIVGFGGFLTALGTYLTFFKEQFPEQPPADKEPANTLPPLENGAAPTQQQIDDEWESGTGTSVVAQPTPVAIPATDGRETTIDNTVTTESGEITTPIFRTTLPQEQAENESTVETVDFIPADDLLIGETAASHEQRIDDEIESIVDTPLAKGLPPLSEAILELMYQSPEHNLLTDEHLLHEVTLLLEQHSKSTPEKTYVELIQAVQAHSPAQTLPPQSETTPATPRPALAPVRVKREANFAGPPPLPAMAAMSAADDVDTPASTISDEERLDQYLATMAGLHDPHVAPDQGIENEIDTAVDPELSAAREVVKLLRSRRSVTWAEASRATGDLQLMSRYTQKVLASLTFPMTDATLVVPTHSTFGRCWSNYNDAIKNPFFQDWAAKVGLELATVKVHLDTNSLSGMTNGQRTKFTLTDNSGWARVSGPILRAANVISPTHHTVAYPLPAGAVPFTLVAAFHGETELTDMATAQSRASELNANGAFFPLPADDPFRPAELRSEATVESQKQHLGDIYSHHRLVTALNSLIQGKSDDASVKLDDVLMAPSFDSTFALKHPAEAQKMVSAHRYISASGWTVPTNVAQARNLIEVLSTAIPASPKTGNFWGAFAYPRPLTSTQRNIITSETRSFLGTSAANGLLEKLLQDTSFSTPAQGLKLALNTEEAETLGKTLALKLDALPTADSAAEWAMAALLLDLDPTPGQPRNHVAGYDLTQQANLGAKPSAVVSALEQYLVAQGKVTTATAPVAAYHLLAGSAPEFLVRNIPDNLICGTHTWTMLRIAVSRIEQLSPGASFGMKFEDIMKYGDLEPISVGQEIAVQSLSVNPLIDWAIANGVIEKNVSDSYSPQQMKIAGEKFQSVREELAHARDFLTTPAPTRKALALAELTRVFGEGLPYEEPCFSSTGSPMPQPPYSMLDLYTTGHLQPGKFRSSNSEIPTATVESKLGQLKNVAQLFEGEFNKYFDDLLAGSQSVFKYLVSQLPIDDRRSLEYGTQKFYSVRSEAIVEDLTPEVKDNHRGRHGILIRSEYENKVTYFEVFPSSLQIRKRANLPESLPLGGTPATVKYPDNAGKPITIEAGKFLPFDWEAYQKGTPPREGKISKIIIDEIIPQTLRAKMPGLGYTFGVVPNAFAPHSWTSHIASVAVNEHFITGREQLRELAKGVTTWEEQQAYSASVMRFFESLIPFKSCIDNIQSGKTGDAVLDCTLDAAGFVIPGIGVAGKIAQVAKSGAKFIPKVLKITWIAGSNIVINANPLDGVGDLLKVGTNVVGKLGSRAYSAANSGIEQLKNLYGTTKAVDPQIISKRADIARGTVGAAPVGGQTEKVTAVFKDGKWYDYDIDNNRAHGPALKNFRPDSAIGLQRTTFSDGTTAYTNARLFDREPHTIQRMSHTDVVVGDKIYRLDQKHPDVLNELSSAAYFKQAEGLEDVCSFGRIAKRTGNLCFSKIVKQHTRPLKRLQSVQHKRLFPALSVNGASRKVVHERRLYTVANNGNTQVMIPSPLTEPLQFRLHTKGKIVDDKNFGLPNKEVDADLALKTRVVRLDGIVHGIDDQRDARAFLVNYDHKNTGLKPYLVVESDTGLFYYCDYDPAVVDNIAFKKIDTLYRGSLGSELIKAHDTVKDQILMAAGVPINNDFVALPPLDSLYMDLVLKKGFTPQKIEALKAKVALLTPEKQREFVLAVWNRGNVGNVEIAAQTIKIEPIAKPSGFSLLSSADQNKIYANAAKAMVDQQFEATGLKSANQVILNDPSDMQRQVLTRPLVIWEYTRRNAPNYADQILRTGAGNCDQMAWAAKKIITESQGTAEIWNMPGAHTFTLVGVPRGTVAKTVDFSEPEFKDAWVVDPWADISCPASEYMTKLEAQMILWELDGKMLLMTDWLAPSLTQDWGFPTNPQWLDMLIQGDKFPS